MESLLSPAIRPTAADPQRVHPALAKIRDWNHVDRERADLALKRNEHLLDQPLGVQVGVYIVPRGIEIRLDAGVVLFDFDGTVADTEQPLYAGPESCYGDVILKLLADPVHRITASSHLKSKLSPEPFPLTDPDGWKEEWEARKFKECTGSGLDNDSIKFTERLRAVYGIDITYAEFKELYEETRPSHLMKNLCRINLIPGFKELTERLKERGVLMAVCSAAPGDNIDGISQYHGIHSQFTVVHAGAIKKQANGAYSGSGAQEAVRKLEEAIGAVIPASTCVMCGDSAADIGTAALGKLPTVYVKLPGDTDPGHAQKIIDEIVRTLMTKQGVEFGPNTCEVLMFYDYDQIRIVTPRNSMRDPNLPVSWSANDAVDSQALDRRQGKISDVLPTFPTDWAE